MERKIIDRHICNFNIAGFTYWDGCMAFQELKIGSRLRLEREADNKFDPHAVAIYYKDFKLGFIPREDNVMVSKFLDLGYGDIFDLRVQRLSPDAHPEKQVGVVLFLKDAGEVFTVTIVK